MELTEAIPEPGTHLLLAGHPVEIVETTDNVVSGVRLIADEVKQGFDRVGKLLKES